MGPVCRASRGSLQTPPGVIKPPTPQPNEPTITLWDAYIMGVNIIKDVLTALAKDNILNININYLPPGVNMKHPTPFPTQQ